MSEPKRCSRPGCENEAAGKHRWCTPCQTAARRAKSNASNGDVQRASNVSNVQRRETRETSALAEVEALRAEVAMLERQLAQANARPISRGPVDAVEALLGESDEPPS